MFQFELDGKKIPTSFTYIAIKTPTIATTIVNVTKKTRTFQ